MHEKYQDLRQGNESLEDYELKFMMALESLTTVGHGQLPDDNNDVGFEKILFIFVKAVNDERNNGTVIPTTVRNVVDAAIDTSDMCLAIKLNLAFSAVDVTKPCRNYGQLGHSARTSTVQQRSRAPSTSSP